MILTPKVIKVAKPEEKVNKVPVTQEPVIKEEVLEEVILKDASLFDEEEDFLLIEEEDIEGEV